MTLATEPSEECCAAGSAQVHLVQSSVPYQTEDRESGAAATRWALSLVDVDQVSNRYPAIAEFLEAWNSEVALVSSALMLCQAMAVVFQAVAVVFQAVAFESLRRLDRRVARGVRVLLGMRRLPVETNRAAATVRFLVFRVYSRPQEHDCRLRYVDHIQHGSHGTTETLAFDNVVPRGKRMCLIQTQHPWRQDKLWKPAETGLK